jgi:transcription-repair coupling factor (superfamily II helicase)
MPFDKSIMTAKKATFSGVPEGLDGLVLSDMFRGLIAAGESASSTLFFIAMDDQRLANLKESLAFFAPDIKVIEFPAWDCLPYDRVSPHQEIVAKRIATLNELASANATPAIVLTTVNAVLQRVVPRDYIAGAALSIRPGHQMIMEKLNAFLSSNGYSRTGTVMEPGDYAVRGGIVDLFPPGIQNPVRLDFFGNTVESIRTFDAESQRTLQQLNQLNLLPASEVELNPDLIRKFRMGYVEKFGTVRDEDPLYAAISDGRRYQGVEHWMPLFYDQLSTLFDYAPGAMVVMDHLAQEAHKDRLKQIDDYWQARKDTTDTKAFGAPPYKPLDPSSLYLEESEWVRLLDKRLVRFITPFEVIASSDTGKVLAMSGRQGRNFTTERADEGRNVFDAVASHIQDLQKNNKRVLVASWSVGARERLKGVLTDHGIDQVAEVENWREAQALPNLMVGLIVLGLEAGFDSESLAIVGEQDILGDRFIRQSKRKRRPAAFLTEATSLSQGDLVVHIDHGIARFEGLKTIDAAGAPHDCLQLSYRGGDRLFLPVENIELLSRYGSQDTVVELDRLGGVGWQARKAKLKQRIRVMAEQLIKIAAQRELKSGEIMHPPSGLYDEFCARFPFEETEDQANAIDAVLEDLSSGRPMDRLICGDVGFGKTEVALRAALVAVMAGRQIAVVVPTTLLARQHFATFVERFQGLPVRIEQLSRLISAKDLAKTKEDIAKGEVDIVIGTHALLGKAMKFQDLGLLIIDEEQHFGVAHKERLKEMRANVHVLTLTATPIPRTLQLALTGVRELSLIATPPVDRLAVRTFITPFDPMVLREALLRERYRGGQSFYVCPRVSDLRGAREYLAQHVPELKVATAHGQMASGQLEDIMTAFYEGKYDVLLSTTIIESGIDIPTANTLIVHRADMFGLAQLYQLRGRVGRSKIRAYALFTLAANKKLTDTAQKRLKVLQSLDTLGAGFSLASHDLDIRGAGNLLGDEQSGHIKEVGFELYQDMLEEAVASLRAGDEEEEGGQWSPQINIGTSVLIPENYVSDLQLRLGLYRRLSTLITNEEIEGFAAELIDRFGSFPEEVDHLLKVVAIKGLCRQAGIQSIDAGPKGAVVKFRNDQFKNPAGLVDFINDQGRNAKLRPDHRLVLIRDWPSPQVRLDGTRTLLMQLSKIADQLS